MSLMKKNGFADFARKYGWILLACALVAVMVFIIDGKETTDPAASAPSVSAEVSASTPAEGTGAETGSQERNTTPAVLGGIGAMVVYYVGSRMFDKKKNKKK